MPRRLLSEVMDDSEINDSDRKVAFMACTEILPYFVTKPIGKLSKLVVVFKYF